MSSSSDNIVEALQRHEIVPDVLAQAPDHVVEVSYDGGEKARLGNVLTPTQVQNTPQLSWPTDANCLYTVVMMDPDAPTRGDPKFGQWRHWLVVNVPGAEVSRGHAVSHYVGSGPPKDTGLHRYIFLVYKQPGEIEADPVLIASANKAGGREKWNVTQFAQQHQLGKPVAVNFYLAEYDDYVPTLYAQFTE